MARTDTAEPRRWRRWFGGFLVVLLVAAAGGAWRLGYAEQWWADLAGDTPAADTPADVEPPAQVDIPPVTTPDVVAAPATAGALDLTAVEQALAGFFADPDVGPHALAAVAPLRGSGASHVQVRGNPLATPASITKVVTSAVALAVLGGDHRFTTRTTLDTTTDRPTVVLVGGGDPYLAAEPYRPSTSATFDLARQNLTRLANRTARQLKQQDLTRIRLGYDATLFVGPGGHPTWVEDPDLEVGAYLEDEEIAPISALWVDQGAKIDSWGREADPPRAAASLFARLLSERGIEVEFAGAAPTSTAATDLVVLRGAPLSQVVQRLLEVSDNSAAEVLLRHVGLAVEGEGSFAAGAAAVRRTLAAHGIQLGDGVLHDGSGLSRASRISPEVLVEVIRWVADPAQPELRPVLAGLPVAGFTGSLSDRMDEAPPIALGRVRAKTGTLTGVTTLAGIALDRDGTPLVFVLMADRIGEDADVDAREAQDSAAAALAACDCAG